MKKFRDLPLSKKLAFITALSSGVALLILTAVMAIYLAATYRSRLLQDATAMGDLYSLTVSAALNFDDPKAAAENLGTLNSKPDIGLACVYRKDGTLLAHYTRTWVSTNPCLAHPQISREEYSFSEKNLNIFSPVVYAGELIGMLHLQYKLSPFLNRFFDAGIILIVVTLALILVSILILFAMKRYVSDPVLKLAQTAQLISSKQEYFHRAAVWSNDEMGKLTYAFNQMLDTIENSLSLHRATLESTAEGILVVNRQERISSYNKKFIDLWNIPESILDSGREEQVNSFVLGQLKYPEVYMSKIAELHLHPHLESFDIVEFKDGRIFERNSRPQKIDQKIVGRVWSFRDVTLQVRTEQSLRLSESRFRRVSDSNMIGIIFSDFEGNIFEANDYFLGMVGYEREALDSGELKWTNLTPPEFRYLDEAAIRDLSQRGVVEAYEKEFIRKDGSRVPILLGAALLEGSQTDNVAFFLDISERKKAEQERDSLLVQEREARLEAEKALKLREEFISIAAHELRTPLTPLKLQNDALKMIIEKHPDFPQAESLLKFIKISHNQIGSLNRLVGELLDFNLIRSGRLNLVKQKIDFTQLVEGMVELYQETFLKNNIEVGFHRTEKIIGNWDRLRIEQVVNNLFSNAVKFGSGKPIEITVSGNNDYAKLIVKDFGIGVEQKDHERIFNRFERASSVDHYGGFGLGLYIAREIIEVHNGHIFLESEEGKGTTIIVELPLNTDL